MALSGSYADEICKMGHGEIGCRYLAVDADGLKCLKCIPQMKDEVDRRVATSRMRSKSEL